MKINPNSIIFILPHAVSRISSSKTPPHETKIVLLLIQDSEKQAENLLRF